MGSTSYWGPDEPTYDILLERSFLAGDFLSGMGYGMQFILYISCVLFLWKTRKSRGKRTIYLLVYITFLLCIETMYAAIQARAVQSMYIDNRNYPSGPWGYFLETQSPVIVMFFTTLFILTILADILMLWRCWVIWGGSGTWVSYGVIALPFLMVLGSIAMGAMWIEQSSQPGISLYNALPIAFGTAYYVMSLSLNILLSIFIAARLLVHRRKAMSSLPPGYATHYFSLATIFVESAALYSISALTFIICYTLKNPISQILLCITSSAQQIAGYLIIYRLAEGRAWNQGTSVGTETKLQTLRFHQPTSEGTASAGSTNLETPVEEKKGKEEISLYIA